MSNDAFFILFFQVHNVFTEIDGNLLPLQSNTDFKILTKLSINKPQSEGL